MEPIKYHSKQQDIVRNDVTKRDTFADAEDADDTTIRTSIKQACSFWCQSMP